MRRSSSPIARASASAAISIRATATEIFRAVREIESGILWINAPLLDNDALPFGGRKLSGTGRQLGPEGLSQFQNTKFVMIDPQGDQPGLLVVPLCRRGKLQGRERRLTFPRVTAASG